MEIKNKEAAYSDFMEAISGAETWGKLTEKERETFVSAVNPSALTGTYEQRLLQLDRQYEVFLSALGYFPFGWRDSGGEEYVSREILKEALTDSKKAIAAFLIRGGYTDDLDCAETIDSINCIFEPIEKKYGIKVK